MKELRVHGYEEGVSGMDQIQRILEDAVQSGQNAGCNLLVIKDGKEILYCESGFADVEQGKKIERNNIFRLASMTKPVTAAAVMVLVEEGRLSLLDPVSTYLPGFKNQKVAVGDKLADADREVKVKDLMNMTAGLVYPGDNSVSARAVRQVYADMESDRTMTTVEAANRFGQSPLAFQPGEGWCYSVCAEVLGAVVEVVSGMRFGDFLEERIFKPLGMKDTAFYVPEEKQERLAKAYIMTENGPVCPVGMKCYMGISVHMEKRPAFESGGGGLASTADDYARFGIMLLNGGIWNGTRILKPRTVDFLTKACLNELQQKVFIKSEHNFPGYSYGNLMCVLQKPENAAIMASRGEYGWHGMLGTWFSNSPEDKVTMVYMEQCLEGRTRHVFSRLYNAVMTEMGDGRL